jgi:hypothetical protein
VGRIIRGDAHGDLRCKYSEAKEEANTFPKVSMSELPLQLAIERKRYSRNRARRSKRDLYAWLSLLTGTWESEFEQFSQVKELASTKHPTGQPEAG